MQTRPGLGVLEPIEGGHPRAGRADIAGYQRAVFRLAGEARVTLVEAQALADANELQWCYAFSGPRAFEATARARVTRGVVHRFERVHEQWTTSVAGAALGETCAKDQECRGFARCDQGRCEVATTEPVPPAPDAGQPPK